MRLNMEKENLKSNWQKNKEIVEEVEALSETEGIKNFFREFEEDEKKYHQTSRFERPVAATLSEDEISSILEELKRQYQVLEQEFLESAKKNITEDENHRNLRLKSRELLQKDIDYLKKIGRLPKNFEVVW